MSGPIQTEELSKSLGIKCLYFLSIVMVLLGLINSTPGIPGYDDLVAQITGREGATFRRFPFEWFYPFFFSLMMIIVALKHSLWRSWRDRSPLKRRFGLFMDIALALMGSRNLHNILH